MVTAVGRERTIGRYAWAAAWLGLVGGQLHAMARHNTVDGQGDLDLPLTRLWSEPARSALRPLLDWAGPDAVYLTYGKLWFPLFVSFTLCAFVIHQRRRPVGFEKWAWRVALTGYVWACVGVFCEYWTQLATYNAMFEPAFVVTLPGLLLVLVGSTLLGIALLRNGIEPVLPAWLLASEIPLAVAIGQVTSMGSLALPVMFAFGLLGRRLADDARRNPVGAAEAPAAVHAVTRLER